MTDTKKKRRSGKRQTNNELATRLALSRRALGYDKQVEFLQAFNSRFAITPQRWINFESGCDRITVNVALALCDRFDLSLDWIYRGKRGELPASVLRAIEDIEAVDLRRRKLRGDL